MILWSIHRRHPKGHHHSARKNTSHAASWNRRGCVVRATYDATRDATGNRAGAPPRTQHSNAAAPLEATPSSTPFPTRRAAIAISVTFMGSLARFSHGLRCAGRCHIYPERSTFGSMSRTGASVGPSQGFSEPSNVFPFMAITSLHCLKWTFGWWVLCSGAGRAPSSMRAPCCDSVVPSLGQKARTLLAVGRWSLIQPTPAQSEFRRRSPRSPFAQWPFRGAACGGAGAEGGLASPGAPRSLRPRRRDEGGAQLDDASKVALSTPSRRENPAAGLGVACFSRGVSVASGHDTALARLV